jgi:hypothetical protein
MMNKDQEPSHSGSCFNPVQEKEGTDSVYKQ